MQENRSGRLEELDFFNAVSCLLVILVHVLSIGITTLDRGSWQLALIYFPWNLSAFVVPAFLFSGAVKMAGQLESDVSYIPYILRRIRKIYLPYVIAVAIYYPVFLHLGIAKGSVRSFFSYLFIGNLSSHFYYIVIVMQFYILMPLWRQLVKRIPWYIALTVSMIISLIMLKSGAVLQCFGITFKYSDRVFLTYLFFWVLGLYVGQNYSAVRDSIMKNRRAVLLSGLAVLLFGLINYLQYAKNVYIYDGGHLKPFTDTLSILILLCLCIALKESSLAGLKRLLSKISRASYTVYLYHSLFLTAGTVYLQRIGVTEMSLLIFLRAAITYTLPFVVYLAAEKLKAVGSPR